MEHQARQRFVLDTALKVFSEKGIEETTMEDIAVASEYTRRTLYSYFQSRDEIFMLVTIDDNLKRREVTKTAVARETNGRAKLKAWADTFFTFASENPYTLKLQLYWDYNGVFPDRISEGVFQEFERVNNQLADDLITIIKKGKKDGSFKPSLDTKTTVSHFIYTLRAVANRATINTYSFAKFKPENYFNHFLETFLDGIKREPNLK